MLGAPLHPDLAFAVASFSHSAYMCILTRKFCDQVTIHELQVYNYIYLHTGFIPVPMGRFLHKYSIQTIFLINFPVTSVKKCLLQFPKELHGCMQSALYVIYLPSLFNCRNHCHIFQSSWNCMTLCLKLR